MSAGREFELEKVLAAHMVKVIEVFDLIRPNPKIPLPQGITLGVVWRLCCRAQGGGRGGGGGVGGFRSGVIVYRVCWIVGCAALC